MAYETILFDITEGVAVITLNRPDKLNSFTEVMHHELHNAFAAIAKDDGLRAVVLTGAGRGFCAGQDLSDRVMDSDEDGSGAGPAFDLGDTLTRLYNPLVRAITTLEKPVICAVNGVAAGAGANVALACDIVVAGESASFLEPFCRLGLVPDAGGTWSLTRLVGPARARGMSILGDKIPAKKAEEWGLIWSCLPDEELMEAAMKMAKGLAQGPTRGYAGTKQAIQSAAAGASLEDQLLMEAEMQSALGNSEDYKEGVTAFLAKRKPEFKGR